MKYMYQHRKFFHIVRAGDLETKKYPVRGFYPAAEGIIIKVMN